MELLGSFIGWVAAVALMIGNLFALMVIWKFLFERDDPDRGFYFKSWMVLMGVAGVLGLVYFVISENT